MNVAVVYVGSCKHASKLADDMARYARTHAISSQDFQREEVVDLLLLGFDCPLIGNPKEVEAFISTLDRQHVKNIALFSLFKMNNKAMNHAIDLCYKQDLPLMREQYCCKLPLHGELSDAALQGGRIYVEDMITICKNYY